MDTKNKTRIFIMHPRKEDVIDPLKNVSKDFDNLEIVGFGPHSKSTIQNLALNQPDVLITSLLSLEEIEQISELVSGIQIILLTNNPSMGKDMVDKAQKKGLYNVSELDITNKETGNPRSVLDLISSNDEIEIASPKKKDADDKSMDVLSKGLEKSSNEETQENKTKPKKDERPKEKDNDHYEYDTDTSLSQKKRESIVESMSLQSKMISFYSLKGGVGTTTLAKEVANLYSGIRMPKTIKAGKSDFMKVALVDFDFDKGNVRSQLGIEKITPNLYLWIEDIIQKLENGVSINQIRYTNIQILSQYARKVDREFFAFTTGQGGFPTRLMTRIRAIDKKGDLPQRVIEKILVSLRRAFHVVVVDTSSNLDEITLTALEESDNIALVTDPTIPSFENLKVTMDEFKNVETLDKTKIRVILNKTLKKDGLEDDAKEILSSITFKIFDYEEEEEKELPLEVIQEIEYDENVLRASNSFDFVTSLNPTNFKKNIISICENFLPIFKVKPKRVLADAKINNPKLDKGEARKQKQKLKEQKKKEHKEKLAKKKTAIPKKLSEMNIKQFIAYLRLQEDVDKTALGFPRIDSKPPKLKSRVWKQYLKISTKEIKKASEAKKRKEKAKEANS